MDRKKHLLVQELWFLRYGVEDHKKYFYELMDYIRDELLKDEKIVYQDSLKEIHYTINNRWFIYKNENRQ